MWLVSSLTADRDPPLEYVGGEWLRAPEWLHVCASLSRTFNCAGVDDVELYD